MAGIDDAAGLCTGFIAAWNAHDMDAFGALFSLDATFVNRFGAYWRGREQIVAEHAAIHRTIYRDMWLEQVRVDVVPLTDALAIVHFRSLAHMGPAMPGGPRELETEMLLVAQRTAGAWLIRAGENVAVLDPRTGAPILTDAAH